MALRFNGTDGFLEFAGTLCTATGYTMAVMVATDKSGPNGEQVCVSQGSTTNDAFMTVGFNGSSEGKYATDRADGVGSLTSQKTSSPNISAASFGWLIGSFTSNTSRSVAFGSSAFSTPDTTNSAQNYSHLNRCLIGATRRAAGLLQHAKADLAEAHWFNRILTSGEIDALVAGTTKPEEISGWVDGWTLQTFSAGGTYASMGGTRSMTAAGGVTASPLTHPIARTPAGPTGPTINTQPSNAGVTVPATATFSVSATASAGSLSYQWQRSTNSGSSWANVTTGTGGTTASYTTAATTVSGGNANNGDQYRCAVTDSNGTTNTSAATLTAAAAVLVVTTDVLEDETNTVLAGLTVAKVAAVRLSDLALVCTWANQTTNGAGRLSLANAALTAVPHLIVTSSSDGADAGAKVYTPA